MMLPVEPMARHIATRQTPLGQWQPNDARSWHRAVARGTISDKMADRICITYLDIQPELIWPTEWFAE